MKPVHARDRADRRQRVRDFGEAVENSFPIECALFDALEAASRGVERVWMGC